MARNFPINSVDNAHGCLRESADVGVRDSIAANTTASNSNNSVFLRAGTREGPIRPPAVLRSDGWQGESGRHDSPENYRYLIALNPRSFLVWLPRFERAAPSRWLPSCAGLFIRGSAKRKTRVNAPPKKEKKKKKREKRREIHIKREKIRKLNLALTMLVRRNMFAHFRHPSPHLSLCFTLVCLLYLPFSRTFLYILHLPLSFFPLSSNVLREKKTLLHARSRRKDVPLTAYTNPSCLNSLANYFHSVSLFPCISCYQNVCARHGAVCRGRVVVSGINFRNNERCLIHSFPVGIKRERWDFERIVEIWLFIPSVGYRDPANNIIHLDIAEREREFCC